MKFVALVFTVLSSFALADGIPVPLNQQTPYNWTCAQGSLHLFTKDVTAPTVYLHLPSGTVGVKVPGYVASALKSQNYSSIDGKTFTDTQFKRTISFDVQGKQVYAKIQEGTFKMIVSNCAASFAPTR